MANSWSDLLTFENNHGGAPPRHWLEGDSFGVFSHRGNDSLMGLPESPRAPVMHSHRAATEGLCRDEFEPSRAR